MTPSLLIHECRRRGATLRRDGYGLEIQRPSFLTAGLIQALKANKPAILAILETETIHTARQVVAGEFIGASTAMIESITVSLRASRHPLCSRALLVLAGWSVQP